MRIIKFRGKHKNPYGDKWVYGYYAMKDGRHVIVMPHADAYISSLNERKPIPAISVEHIIDVNTLGQYTGLKDKNGKEIYEGDIVQHLYEFSDVTDRYLIDYDEDDLSYVFQNISNKNRFIALEDLYDEDYGDYAIEVIGNIYENPELLERS